MLEGVSASEGIVAGGGVMGALIRETDWTKEAVGPMLSWPQSFRTALGMVLDSQFAMAIAWGPELRLFYNDGYQPILGRSKHPGALGASLEETFPEAWAFIGPLMEKTRAGGTVGLEDVLVPLDRNGYFESCWFTFSYSPIRDESGGVGGVLIVVAETTARVEGARRLGTLRDLSRGTAEARSRAEAAKAAVAILGENPADIPFALIYSADHARGKARLVAHCGMPDDHPGTAVEVDLVGGGSWPLGGVMSSRKLELITAASFGIAGLPGGGHPEATHGVAIIPLARPGREALCGFLVAGVSPRRAFDDSYHAFFGLVGEHISAALAHSGAFEDERERAEALAEVDRVKTQFFSNVSHEFRTPLTLMLGPLEDVLAGRHGELSGALAETLGMMRRNSQRLLKLVNTLLDFSRIEAGRVKGAFAPTDLGAYTAELASVFRAAMEGGQLSFVVDGYSMPAPTRPAVGFMGTMGGGGSRLSHPGASAPHYERSSAALMPASTAARTSTGSAPSRRVSLARSSVVSWWHTAIPSPLSPPAPSGIGTAVGPRRAWFADVVSGTTVTDFQPGTRLKLS